MLRRIRGTRLAVAATTAAALALGLAACGGSGPKNKDGLGTAGAVAVNHRKPFPVLSGTTLDGAELDLASFKGEVVVMNIWGSWCDSCEAEAPYLERSYETLLTELAGITSLGSLPSTLIIDKNGDLAWRALHPVDSDDLSAALGPVIAEQ